VTSPWPQPALTKYTPYGEVRSADGLMPGALSLGQFMAPNTHLAGICFTQRMPSRPQARSGPDG
jgi:hypothetical protein